jgi:hypothetical protein
VIARLLSWFMPYLWPAVAAAGVSLMLWGSVQTYRVRIAKAETVEVRNAMAVERANATAAALKAQTEYRALEAQMQAIKEQAQHEYDAAQTRNATALAAARAGADKLRNQLAAYAAGSGEASSDSVAACGQRAAALGQLLAEALRLDAERAADAEDSADAVRALLAAWPHQ